MISAVRRAPAFAAAALLAAGLAGGLTLRSVATPAAPAAPIQPRVAVVNLELMNNLTEFADRGKEVQSHLDTYQKEIQDMADRIKAIDNELEVTIPKTDLKRRGEKAGERLKLAEQLQTSRKIYQQIINLEQGDVVRELYGKLVVTVKALAEKEGYDLVLLDDSGLRIPERATAEEFGGLLRQRAVLYRADALDISDHILTRMNNEYATKGGSR
jgi:Skp family chaperone for outer membrane proteins